MALIEEIRGKVEFMRQLSRPREQDRLTILFVITEDWYFLSHRLALARACRDLGWSVIVATRVERSGEQITKEGFKLIPIGMRRGDRRVIKGLRTFAELIWIFARERPDIVHQVGLMPVILGSLAAILVRPTAVINALAGMGYIFTSGRLIIRFVRMAVKAVLLVCLRRRNHWLILQNDDDAAALVDGKFITWDHVAVIKGSGVDLVRFAPTPEPDGPVVVAVISRMLKDKGIREVVLAARELRRRGNDLRVRLVGAPDPDNPSSIKEETLRQWHNEGCVEWLGHREDVAAILSNSHIAVLPSYREGMPKSLIEAAACGRPIVTTNVPGCNQFVSDRVNGYLVPTQDWAGLADAIEELANAPDLRARMGEAGRSKVEAEYGESDIVRQTLNFYQQALQGTGRTRRPAFQGTSTP